MAMSTARIVDQGNHSAHDAGDTAVHHPCQGKSLSRGRSGEWEARRRRLEELGAARSRAASLRELVWAWSRERTGQRWSRIRQRILENRSSVLRFASRSELRDLALQALELRKAMTLEERRRRVCLVQRERATKVNLALSTEKSRCASARTRAEAAEEQLEAIRLRVEEKRRFLDALQLS
mmetsp:Transcript_9279/g.18911  ORF Transcript_9279/g.18911 Transcript_9279/m.18911 type:complete len:180 (+) Transcript_9279:1325-1864(+)